MPIAAINDVQIFYRDTACDEHGTLLEQSSLAQSSQDSSVSAQDQPAQQNIPIIFLHGLGISSRDWDAQIEHFSPNWRVIAPDFRGHGQSEKPKCEYSVPGHAADVIALMDALNIQQAHIVGLSMGGMVAFQMAADTPDRLASMVIVNSGPALPNDTFAAKKMLWSRLAAIYLLGMDKYAHKVASNLFKVPDAKALVTFAQEQIAANPRSVYIKNLKSLWGWGVMDRLSSIPTPTLMLTGDQDYSPVAVKQAVVDAMMNAELQVINGSGHGTPMEKPEQTNEAIERFLIALP